MEVNNINKTVTFTVEINGIKQEVIELAECPENGEIEAFESPGTNTIQCEISLPEVGHIILNDKSEIEDVTTSLSENTANIQTELSPSEICTSRIKKEVVIEDDHEVKSKYTFTYTAVGVELNAWDNNANNIVARPPISEICDIKTENVKLENDNINNNELLCNHSYEIQQSYCTTCHMLIHILDRNIVGNSARGRIPRNIVEIRKILNSTGIFALKLIPERVKFGPFTGLNTSNSIWKIKQGKFLASILHWMWHINMAESVLEGNLLPFQSEGKLYYRTSRDIQVGEQLLVYFGEEYINGFNENIEMDFIPCMENNVRDVFACTFCCLGFSSRMYLTKHNDSCSKRIFGKSSNSEIRQCPFCKVYMEAREYRKYHLKYCHKKRIRKRMPSVVFQRARKQRKVSPESSAPKNQQHKMYHRCSRCKYKTKYKSEFQEHINQHHQVKLYGCSICCKKFSRRQNLKLHVILAHIDIKGERIFKCLNCNYKTSDRWCLNIHVRVKHKARHRKDLMVRSIRKLETKRGDYDKEKLTRLKVSLYSGHEMALNEFKCAHCEYQTHKKRYLTKHLAKCKYVHREHTSQKRFKCADCKYESTREELFKKHVAVVHSEDKESLKCTYCEYVASCPALLTRHLYTHDKSNKPLKCSKCDYAVHRLDSLKEHMFVHEKAKFQCGDCEFRTKRQSALDIHILRIHRRQGKPGEAGVAEGNTLGELRKYKCRDYDCNRIDKLTEYEPTERRKPLKRNNSECTYETSFKYHLHRHIQSKHYDGPMEKKYKCPNCDYASAYKFDLKLHLPIHDEDKKFQCYLCDFKTHRKGILVQHLKSKHETEKEFRCSECEYSTSNRYYLKTHVESNHRQGQRRYKCTKCDFETAYRDSLKGHMGIHEEVKQFKCSKCPYETNDRKKFNVHVRVKHVEGKQFKCTKCEFRTGYKDSLKEHLKLHDNLKEFKCSFCDFETHYKKSLRQHTERKHTSKKKKK